VQGGFNLTHPRKCILSLLLLVLWPLGCENPEAVRVPTSEKRPKPVKLIVVDTGVYRIRMQDLSRFGWHPALLPTCSLTSGGTSIPHWLDGVGRDAALCFFAKAADGRYTPYTAYILQPGNKAKPDSLVPVNRHYPAYRGHPGDRFRSTVHFELNQVYEPLAELAVPWLWDRLVAPGKKTFEIKLEGILKGASSLRVRLWAKTQAPLAPDHHLRVAANDVDIIDQKWDGAGPREITISIPDGVLREGTNRITMELPGDTKAPAEIIFLDSMDLSYLRRLQAGENDTLEFSRVDGTVVLRGFSGSITVIDSGNRQPAAELSSAAPLFAADATRFYFAVGSQGFLKPTRLEVFGGNGPNLRNPSLEADYIAIGSPELLAPLAPLLSAHETSGLKTLAVPKQAVYDQFDNGKVEPEAVRSFLRYAVEKWKRAPRYLLLVGDASYDTLGFLEPPNPDLLPGFFTRTAFGGETVTDVEFGRIREGSRPQIAVGRIPARTPEQVRILVEKILEFRKTKSGGSRGRIMALADSSDASFREEAGRFLAEFPARFQKILYSPSEEVGAAKGNGFGRTMDPLLFFYFGHGSIRQLGRGDRGKDQRLDLQLSASAPIAFHVTCLSGFYVHPRVDCLAEELLFEPESKVLALLAPTGLTLPEHQRYLVRGLVAPLLKKKQLRVGDLVLEAWQEADPDGPGQREVIDTFLLFGCPAVELPPL